MRKIILCVAMISILVLGTFFTACGTNGNKVVDSGSDHSQTDQGSNTDQSKDDEHFGEKPHDPNTQNPAVSQPNDPDKDDPNKDAPDAPDTPKTPEELEKELLFEEANAFLDKLSQNNYTYYYQGATACRQDGLLAYTIGGPQYYFEKNDDKTFRYAVDPTDNLWHKKAWEDDSIYQIVDDVVKTVQSIEWSSKDGEVFVGQLKNIGKVKMTFANDRQAEFVGNMFALRFADVGSTVVSLPAKEQTVDETTGYVPPQIQGNNLYKIVDGQKQWNFPLLKETLQTWMIENDYYSRLCYGIDKKLSQIVFLNFNEKDEKLEFCATVKVLGKNAFQNFKSSKELYNNLINGEISTPENLQNYLYQKAGNSGMGGCPVDIDGASTQTDYSTLDEDYATHKAEFEKMTQNIFERLETIGYQGGSINNPGTVVEDYHNAKILFGMKGTDSSVNAGFDMGFTQGCTNRYILEINGKIKFVEIGFVADANSSKNPLQHVLDNTNQKKWLIVSVKDNLLQCENLNLYVNSYPVKSKE